MKFTNPPSDVIFPRIEEEVLARWKERRAFERSIEQRSPERSFSFYDGPPFATGLPHYGHLLVGTIKDVVARYHTMQGCRVERRFGWDCHGLPVEFEVEKQLELSGRQDIEDYGVDRFNETCRSIVLRYSDEWREVVTRFGRWVDFDNDYKTMDVSFMESVWSVFKTLWERDLIYEGYRVVPYSWRIGAPLSNFEANLNYQDVQDPSVTVKFKADNGLTLLAWTTTPWTLPSNLGLAVNPEADYAIVEEVDDNGDPTTGEQLVLHAERVAAYWPDDKGIRRVGTISGTELAGLRYAPLFPYFAERAEEGAFRVLPGAFVTAESGTGIVHTAPAFGEDDFMLGREHGIEPVDPVDGDGKFTEAVPDYQGLVVKDADKKIIADLKAAGSMLRHDTIVHSYPFCYRSDTPLIYKSISAWYVNVETFKEQLIANNQKIHWVPDHLKDGRFGKWLEGARDWNISRNRYWGNPLPIWRNEETGETICVGSRDELEELSGVKVDDLHKHIVDDVVIPSPTGRGELRRIPEVLDCWFESGSMPYGQAHYPFEDADAFENGYPADFITEALDQTRGWFYTLLVLSTALFDKPAYKNVICSGLVLAEDGRKMSKSLKNYPEPTKLVDELGADAIRIYLLDSPLLRGEELRFSETGVRDMVRRVLLPWWNSVSFLMTYASVDGWDPETDAWEGPPTHELDVWIRAKLEELKEQIEREMAEYRLYRVVDPLLAFLDDLTNWYIRRSRRRFWKSESDDDKRSAYTTLYGVMLEFTELMAPLTPFTSDYIYEFLRVTPDTAAVDSVHLRDVPARRDITDAERELESRIDLSRVVCELGRSLRAQAKIRNRQPLRAIRVGTTSHQEAEWLLTSRDVILEELNIKDLEVIEDPTQVATASIKPNMSKLGPRLGAEARHVAAGLAKLDADSARKLAFGENVEVAGIELTADDVYVNMEPADEGALVAAQGNLVVALDPHLNDDLKDEGIARDVVNRIQRMRKEMDYPVEARIDVALTDADAGIVEAVEKNREIVEGETLSNVSTATLDVSELRKEDDIDGKTVTVEINLKDIEAALKAKEESESDDDG
ncbi:MAG: isoleucine--tRNA ligase [Acidobacteria bacterium]|nr:isoleucine--tRNA ligase [Acidobacteriota bacterium]